MRRAEGVRSTNFNRTRPFNQDEWENGAKEVTHSLKDISKAKRNIMLWSSAPEDRSAFSKVYRTFNYPEDFPEATIQTVETKLTEAQVVVDEAMVTYWNGKQVEYENSHQATLSRVKPTNETLEKAQALALSLTAPRFKRPTATPNQSDPKPYSRGRREPSRPPNNRFQQRRDSGSSDILQTLKSIQGQIETQSTNFRSEITSLNTAVSNLSNSVAANKNKMDSMASHVNALRVKNLASDSTSKEDELNDSFSPTYEPVNKTSALRSAHVGNTAKRGGGGGKLIHAWQLAEDFTQEIAISLEELRDTNLPGFKDTFNPSVCNFTDTVLTHNNLLMQGIGFAPRQSNCEFDTKVCLNKLSSSLDQFSRYHNLDPGDAIPAYTCTISQNISSVEGAPKPFSKLTKELKENDLIVKKADKSTNLCILKKDQYHQAVETTLLSNRTKFKIITSDRQPFQAARIKALTLTLREKKQITFQEYKDAQPVQPFKERSLYGLPKTHKDISKWKNGLPPFRPILSGCGSATAPAERLLATLLLPVVKSLKCHVVVLQNTYQLLDLINDLEPLQDGNLTYLLASVDVNDLYGSIPHLDGTEAIRWALRTTNSYLDRDTIVSLAYILLTQNTFNFNNTKYLQIQGAAMGASFAPQYANIFMTYLESSIQTRYPLHVRYLDDILVIKPAPADSPSGSLLTELTTLYNSLHPSITVEGEESKHLNFLDVTLFNHQGSLAYQPFWKETHTQEILLRTSAHPYHVFRGLYFGTCTRFKRLSSHTCLFASAMDTMNSFFLRRKYPAYELKRWFNEWLLKQTQPINTEDIPYSQKPSLTLPFTQPHKEAFSSQKLSDLHEQVKEDTGDVLTSRFLNTFPHLRMVWNIPAKLGKEVIRAKTWD